MFSLLPIEVVKIILLQSKYKELLNLCVINRLFYTLMNEEFWKNKHGQDIFIIKYDKFLRKMGLKTWKDAYLHTCNVHNQYPELLYNPPQNKINLFCIFNRGQVFSHENPEVFFDILSRTISNYKAIIIKTIPVANKYIKRSKDQKIYEDNFARFIRTKLQIISKMLDVGDCISIYTDIDHNSFSCTLTKHEDCYKLTFLS